MRYVNCQLTVDRGYSFLRLNDWRLILDPVPRSVLVCWDRAFRETLYVTVQHLRLILVGRILLRCKKGMFLIYIAQYPVRWTTQNAVRRIGRPIHYDTNSASPGSILAMQQLRATTKSLTFPPLSIARYSFMLSGLRRRGQNENGQTSKR